MVRILTCILALLCTAGAYSMECSQLRIASGVTGWAPISYKDKASGRYHGVAFDVIQEVSKRLNIPVTTLDIPWKRVLLYMETGNLDLALAIYKNKEREKKYLYTHAYFSNEARVFVKKGHEFPFNRLEDLVGRSGVVPAGGSFGEEFDSFAEKNLKLYKVSNPPFKEKYHKLILNQRWDYYIADYLDGISHLKKAGLQNKIVPLPHPIDKNDVYFAFSRKSPCQHLLPQINKIVEQLKFEGFILRKAEKYQN